MINVHESIFCLQRMKHWVMLAIDGEDGLAVDIATKSRMHDEPLMRARLNRASKYSRRRR